MKQQLEGILERFEHATALPSLFSADSSSKYNNHDSKSISQHETTVRGYTGMI
jgi:hypothetical protein